MAELQAGFTANKPAKTIADSNVQASSANSQPVAVTQLGSVSTQAPSQTNIPQAMNADDVQHLMQGGKINRSSVADIVYEWQTSKIVKVGSFILYLSWIGVIESVYHVAGLIAWVTLTIAIFINYKWYKKTRSEVAWKILQSLIGVIFMVMIGFAIAGHYYVP